MRRALAILRQRPADVLVALLAFVAFFALCVGFMIALPDALPGARP